ncbi:hypothetical protein FHS15_001300 [Paenibacillus castaneae]|nr:hypothetical protein [Paenibacillus castaneae]NIK76193.1 hypothetical protein [Paenibacillus castaneae]
MKFRIENKEAFQVIGITNRVTPIEMVNILVSNKYGDQQMMTRTLN